MAQAAAVQIKLLLIFGPHGFYINANVGLLVVFMAAQTPTHSGPTACAGRRTESDASQHYRPWKSERRYLHLYLCAHFTVKIER